MLMAVCQFLFAICAIAAATPTAPAEACVQTGLEEGVACPRAASALFTRSWTAARRSSAQDESEIPAEGDGSALLPGRLAEIGDEDGGVVEAAMQLAGAAEQQGDIADQALINSAALLGKLRAPGTNSSENDELLKQIDTVIADVLLNNLRTGHKHDQEEINGLHAKLVQCDLDRQAAETGIIADLRRSVEEKRSTHMDCRTAESGLPESNASAWGTFEADNQSIPPAPDCPQWSPEVEAMEEFFDPNNNAFLAWYLKYQGGFLSKKQAFEHANRSLSTKQRECGADQHNFEQEFCNLKGSEVNQCSIYQTCRETNLHFFRSVKGQVQKSEARRKTMYMAGRSILCLTKVMGRDKTHKECDRERTNYSTAEFDLDIPDEPPAAECNANATTVAGPCETAFIGAEYVDLPSDVELEPCLKCPWQS